CGGRFLLFRIRRGFRSFVRRFFFASQADPPPFPRLERVDYAHYSHPTERRVSFHLSGKGLPRADMSREREPQAAAMGDQPQPRRANRRLNGRAEKAGLPEPSKRGRLCRDLALIDAALR